MRVYDTHTHPKNIMANQRRKGVSRVTLTIPDELLALAEAEAERRGIDRLAVIREALEHDLKRSPSEKSEAKPRK